MQPLVRTLDGQVDTSSENSMQKAMTQLLGVFAELDHSIIVVRLQSGRERTDRKCGIKSSINDSQKPEIKHKIGSGISISSIARENNTSRATIHSAIKIQ